MLRGAKLAIVLVFMAGLVVACGGGAQETITLVENPWPASELNVAVAKIIIENELGNPVEIVALDENAQWDAISGGDVDASLEVWPSGHTERIAEYIDDLGTVENGGLLGPVGEIGWFVPSYVIDNNPALATWEGYKDAAADFASAETGDLGRFLGADPSWVQYDEQIISNLDLPFQVVWTGSEDALLAEVSSAYSRQEPVLFYFYSPHAIFQQFDLSQVELPAYSDECYADPAAIDCAYPKDELLKIFNANLQEKDPDVHAFLSNMNYGSDAQIEMLAMLNEGMTVEEAAQAWVDAHEDVWRSWLP
ncbi:MAG TPA: glycine/betaine ABC transporter substrate-binding protein [Chloroflexi bacterium]|nr:glycine/betaine ABC transporter substrate-binding protein [Chloroflexota bacterium]